MMYGEPAVWHALMEKLTETFIPYVQAKVEAGADVIQLFDSWIGALSPADYEEFVAPYSARILDAVDVPTIHFGTGTATLLGLMADAGGDVIGVDWRIPLDVGLGGIGESRGDPGQPRPASPCSARGSAPRQGRSTCSRAPPAGPATSQPRPRRASRHRSRRPRRLVELVHERTASEVAA